MSEVTATVEVMKYNDYAYLWPPRPELRVPRELFQHYEKNQWWAQTKKNGTCTVIFTNGTDVIYKTRRYNEDHKAWQPLEEHSRLFRRTSDGMWNVFVGELLHNKTKHIKNHLYLFDLIALGGQQLVGVSYAERYGMLSDVWPTRIKEGIDDQMFVDEHLSVARCLLPHHKGEFAERFNNLKEEDEGLVLKDPKALLKPCFKEGLNGSWQVKSRIPTKNYGY